MASEVEELVEQVKSLPTDQQQRFRELLDTDTFQQAGKTTEDVFKQRLPRAGLIREIKHLTGTGVSVPRRRVDIRGKPLSQTVIEERR